MHRSHKSHQALNLVPDKTNLITNANCHQQEDKDQVITPTSKYIATKKSMMGVEREKERD